MNGTFDKTNREMCYAYDLICKTNRNFFLTGRAGTGKTTFLQKVQESVNKNFIVLAPSGIAAIHAGGQTIHSFFGFDFSVQGPLSYGNMNSEKISLVQHVDTIIIDEVSMVRCDIVDAIDRMLRECRHSSLPFGGVQMVFVGDLFQLSPVITQDDKMMLQEIYGSDCFLFNRARCFNGTPLPKIEFRKIYRQEDEYFISLLERFRVGGVTRSDLDVLNSRVIPSNIMRDQNDLRITLTSYKKDAAIINETRLQDINTEQYSYVAEYEGKVERLKDVVDDTLVLKEGAQVMYLRNSIPGRLVNGTICKVSKLDSTGVRITLEDGTELQIEKESWEAYEYVYDKGEKKCIKTVVGRVTQYPLRLAWAITIHKSQSLTFDKVDIDFGRGAFNCGQAYVALSRCRSLEGLRLKRMIDLSSVRVSKEALIFAASYNDEDVITKELAVGEAVNEHERIGDFDGAALSLYSMCDEEAHKGNIHYAYDLLNRALSYVADDRCLFGREWTMIPNSDKESIMLNAAGLLYSGNTSESLGLLSSVVSASDKNFNHLYLLARAVEETENWAVIETLYKQMIDVFEEVTGNGLDSPSFRKFKYRMSLLRERHFGHSGVELMVSLVAENPNYDRYHRDLREMIQKHCHEIFLEHGEDNPMMTAILDPGICEDDFIEVLDRERSGKTKAWIAYRKYLSLIKLGNNEYSN